MKWINIKETPPDTSEGIFLVFIPKGYGYVSFAIWMSKEAQFDEFGIYLVKDFGYGGSPLLEKKENFTREEVTHWMSIPDFPILNDSL